MPDLQDEMVMVIRPINANEVSIRGTVKRPAMEACACIDGSLVLSGPGIFNVVISVAIDDFLYCCTI
jgi:hypothetical protein